MNKFPCLKRHHQTKLLQLGLLVIEKAHAIGGVECLLQHFRIDGALLLLQDLIQALLQISQLPGLERAKVLIL